MGGQGWSDKVLIKVSYGWSTSKSSIHFPHPGGPKITYQKIKCKSSKFITVIFLDKPIAAKWRPPSAAVLLPFAASPFAVPVLGAVALGGRCARTLSAGILRAEAGKELKDTMRINMISHSKVSQADYKHSLWKEYSGSSSSMTGTELPPRFCIVYGQLIL